MTRFSYTSRFGVPVETLFAFHADVRNLARISPKVPRFSLLSEPKETEAGDLQVFRLSVGPLGVTWEARVVRFEPNELVEDVQERGPFREWRHQHQMRPVEGGSELRDVVSFRLLPTVLGEFVEHWLVRPVLILSFKGRHRATARALGRRVR